MKPKEIIKRIDEIFAFITKYMVENFLIVVTNYLCYEKCYASGRSKAVIIKIGEKNTLSDVFQSIGKDDEIEKVRCISEGDNLEKFGLPHHKFTMF